MAQEQFTERKWYPRNIDKQRICPFCEKVFEVRMHNQIHCKSIECSKEYQKQHDANNYQKQKESGYLFENNRIRSLRWNFGITIEQYDDLFRLQEGNCKICGQHETVTRSGRIKYLAVDHDHITGQIRGLLCQACNQAIGLMRELPDRLRAAADYLEAD